jgi:hypothetical protein
MPVSGQAKQSLTGHSRELARAALLAARTLVWLKSEPARSAAVPNAVYSNKDAAAGQPSFSYFFKMFCPNENFVPTVTRTLLRPPFSTFEK